MANIIDTLTYVITGDLSNLEKSLTSAGNKATQLGKDIEKALTDGIKDDKIRSLEKNFTEAVDRIVSKVGKGFTWDEAYKATNEFARSFRRNVGDVSALMDTVIKKKLDEVKIKVDDARKAVEAYNKALSAADTAKDTAVMRSALGSMEKSKPSSSSSDLITKQYFASLKQIDATAEHIIKTRGDEIKSMLDASKSELESYYNVLKGYDLLNKEESEARVQLYLQDIKSANEAADAITARYEERKKAYLEMKDEIVRAAKEASTASSVGDSSFSMLTPYASGMISSSRASYPESPNRSALAGVSEEWNNIIKAEKEANDEAKSGITNTVDNLVHKMVELSKEVSKSMNSKVIKDATADVGKFSDVLSGVTIGANAFIDLIGTKVSISWIKDITSEAGEAEKAFTQLKAVYGDYISEAENVASEISKSYGMSNKSANQMVAYVGQLLTNQGISAENALVMAENVVKLGVDLQSLTNGADSSEAAIEALSRALLGSAKSAYALGVSFTDADVKTQASLHDMGEELNGVEKIVARYYALMDNTITAQGNFALNSDSLVNIQQKSRAAWNDLAVSMGEEYLPIVKAVLKATTSLAEIMKDSWVARFVAGFAGGVVVVRSLNALVVGLSVSMTKLAAAATSAGVATTFLSSAATFGLSALVTLATAAVTALIQAGNKAEKAANDLSSKVSEAANSLTSSAIISNIDEINESWEKQGKIIKNTTRDIESLKFFLEDTTGYTAGEIKVTEDSLKELESELAESESSRVRSVSELANAYIVAGKPATALEGLAEDFKDEVLKAVDVIEAAAEAGLTLDEELKNLSYESENWADALSRAETHLKKAQEAAGRNEKEYGRLLKENLATLQEEKEASDAAINSRINYIATASKENKGANLGDDDYAQLLKNVDLIKSGKLALEDWSSGISTEAMDGMTDAMKLQFKNLIQDLLNSQERYNIESEAYYTEYRTNILKSANSLSDALIKLSSKTNTTIEEQRSNALTSYEKDLASAVEYAYGKVGGLGDLVGNAISFSDISDIILEASKEADATAESVYATVVSNVNDTLAAYGVDINKLPNDVKNLYSEIKSIVEGYFAGVADINTEYNQKYIDMTREYENAALEIQINSSKISLEKKHELSMKQLDKQHDEEYKALVKELGKEEEATGEAADVFIAWRAKVKAENIQLYEEQNKEMADIQRDYQTQMLNIQKEATKSRVEQHNIEIQILEEERKKALETAAANGLTAKQVNAMYDAKVANSNKTFDDETKENQKSQAMALKQLYIDAEKDYSAKYQMELNYLEAERQQAVAKAKEQGEDVSAINKQYEVKREIKEQEHKEYLENLERSHNQTMLNFAVDAAKGLEDKLNAQKSVNDEAYQYRIDHANETGEKVADIQAEWDAANLKLDTDYNDKIEEVERTHSQTMLNFALKSTKDLAVQVELQKQINDEAYQYRIDHANETGEKVADIQAEWDAANLAVDTAYKEKLEEAERTHKQAMLNFELKDTDSLKEQLEIKKKINDEAYAYRVLHAKENGEDMMDISREWQAANEALDKEYNKKIEKVELDHYRTMLKYQLDEANDALDKYEIQKKITASTYEERIKNAEKNGEKVADIQAEWDKQKLDDYRGYVDDMKSEMDRLYNMQMDYALKANEKRQEKRNGMFSVFNIGDINQEAALNAEKSIREELDKLTGDNAEKYKKFLADNQDFIGDLVSADKSPEEILTYLQDTVGLEGQELTTVWQLICQDMETITEDSNKAILKSISDTIDSLADYLNQIDSVWGMFEDNRTTEIENTIKSYEKQYSALEDSIKERNDENQENLTKKQKDERERRKKLDEEELKTLKAQKEAEKKVLEDEKRKQFDREKAFSIAEATMNGITAAIKSFSTSGWPLGLVNAGLSTAFTAAQIAALISQPYPSYAVGAYDLPQDQMAQVHKGEMIIPKPFADEVRDNGGLGGAITVNVYGAGDGASVESSEGEGDVKQLDIYVSSKVKSMVARGELDGVLQTRYTLSRTGKRG